MILIQERFPIHGGPYFTAIAYAIGKKQKAYSTDVLDEGQQKNELAITDIMEVHAFYILVNTFGDIPYTKALDPTILFPPYDDAKLFITICSPGSITIWQTLMSQPPVLTVQILFTQAM